MAAVPTLGHVTLCHILAFGTVGGAERMWHKHWLLWSMADNFMGGIKGFQWLFAAAENDGYLRLGGCFDHVITQRVITRC